MDIAIIGAGNVGAALARGWTRAGHRIVLGLRDPADPKHAALLQETGADAAPLAAAGARGDVVVLALPWPALAPAVAELGTLAGKIVIDATNPVAPTGHGLDLALGHDTSAAEALARLIPQARVVKTLNQVGAEIMADTSGFAHAPAMFMAGDDAAAKQAVAALLADLGFEPLDAGPLHRARLLEPMAMLWIDQALVRGRGRAWAFAALPRRQG